MWNWVVCHMDSTIWLTDIKPYVASIFQMAGSNATQTISDIEALLDDYSSKLPAA